MRYFEWNYDTHEVIEYDRAGECNGCGDCCVAYIKFITAGVKPLDNGQYSSPTTDNTGIWAEAQHDNGKRYFIRLSEVKLNDHRCKHLSEDNRCGIHAIKPTICEAWPFSPTHVIPFERCSYRFTEINRWKIDE